MQKRVIRFVCVCFQQIWHFWRQQFGNSSVICGSANDTMVWFGLEVWSPWKQLSLVTDEVGVNVLPHHNLLKEQLGVHQIFRVAIHCGNWICLPSDNPTTWHYQIRSLSGKWVSDGDAPRSARSAPKFLTEQLVRSVGFGLLLVHECVYQWYFC